MNMSVYLDQIPKEDIKPNSIVLVRVLPDKEEEVIQFLKQNLHASVQVVSMHRDTEILCVSEELLNTMGWFKGRG